jgi:hypothetical protein
MTASHGWRLLKTLYMYEVDLVGVWSGWGVPIISYSMSPVRNPLKILRLCPPLLEWWYGMVLWQYGCPPHIKGAKHLLYVWSGSGRSMKWMGGPNHILQHVPSEKPRQNPMTHPPLWSDGMVWCCGIMTANHGRRLLNTFYRYNDEVHPVWSGS